MCVLLSKCLTLKLTFILIVINLSLHFEKKKKHYWMSNYSEPKTHLRDPNKLLK